MSTAICEARSDRPTSTPFRTAARAGLLFLGLAVLSGGQARASDFLLNVEFHINTQRVTFDNTKALMNRSITVAQDLYAEAPRLAITPTFVPETNPAIKTGTDDWGSYTYVSFGSNSDLTTFMDANFDNQARTKTDGHLTVLVVDKVFVGGSEICGESTFPHSVKPFSRKAGILLAACTGAADYDYNFSHELGHVLALAHTFETYPNVSPFAADCNAEFGGTHNECNSCQGVASGSYCSATDNLMDHCVSNTDHEVLNACQRDRASRQRIRYQTPDGKTDYQAMAGSAGEGACDEDADCDLDEWCTTGILNLSRNICKAKQDHGSACTSDRQCASDRCAWGICADPDECRDDQDCGTTQYCGDPILGKRSCQAKKAHGAACVSHQECTSDRCAWGQCADPDECRDDHDCSTSQYCATPVSGRQTCQDKKADNDTCALVDGDQQCHSGHCQMGRCYTPNSISPGGTCYVDEACSAGHCSSIDGTKGTCVCSTDADCGSGYWCNGGADLNLNTCERKYDDGEVCGVVGDIDVGHRCKSGKCKASFGLSLNLTCK